MDKQDEYNLIKEKIQSINNPEDLVFAISYTKQLIDKLNKEAIVVFNELVKFDKLLKVLDKMQKPPDRVKIEIVKKTQEKEIVEQKEQEERLVN